MVALAFNAVGSNFVDGLRLLDKAYKAAEDALFEEIDRAKDEAFGHQQAQAQGAEWIGERDENGHVLWDQQAVLDYQVADAQVAVSEIRNAFAIAIYHHWERAAQRWTGLKRGNHDDLAVKTKALGYPLNEKLEVVRLLINTLKHNSVSCAPVLLQARPDFFRDGFTAASSAVSWEEAVALRREHVEELIMIVRESGPDVNTLPNTITTHAVQEEPSKAD